MKYYFYALILFLGIIGTASALDTSGVWLYYNFDNSYYNSTTVFDQGNASQRNASYLDTNVQTGLTGFINQDFKYVKNVANASTNASNITFQPFSMTGYQNYTLSFWMKINDTPASGGEIALFGNTTDAGSAYGLLTSTTNLQIRAGTGINFALPVTLSNSTYQFIMVTFDNSTGNNTVNAQVFVNCNGTTRNNLGVGAFNINMFGKYGGSATGLAFDGRTDEFAIWNGVKNASWCSEARSLGSNGSSYFGSSSSVLQITATDRYDSTSVSNFSANVSINGSTYQFFTTNGTIITNISYNSSYQPLANITVASNQSGGYYPNSTENYNVTTNYAASLFQAQVTFQATEIVTGNNITTFTVTVGNGTQNNTGTNPTVYLKAGSYNFTFNKTGWYNHSIANTAIAAVTNTTQNFTGVYIFLLNVSARNFLSGVLAQNFSINTTSGLYPTYSTIVTTNNGSALTPWTNDTNLNITLFNSIEVAEVTTLYNTTNFTTYPLLINISLSSAAFNSIIFRFYDEKNGSLLNFTTASAYLTSSSYSVNFSTTNGTANVSALVPTNYTITYTATGYNQRTQLFSLLNGSYSLINLYLLSISNATNIEIYIKDQNLLPLSQANVTLNIKNLTGTSDYTISSCSTDANGRCIISVSLYDTTYKIIFSYGGFLGNSDYLQFTNNDALNGRVFYLLVDSNTLEEIYTWSSIGDTARLEFQPNKASFNGTIDYTISNSNSLATDACLYVYNIFGNNKVYVGGQCGTGTAISDSVTVNISAGQDSVLAEGHITYKGVDIIIISDSVVINNIPLGSTDAQKLAVFFVVFGVMITMVLMFTWNPAIPPVIAALTMFVFQRIGLLTMTQTAVTGIIIVLLIIVVLVAKKT